MLRLELPRNLRRHTPLIPGRYYHVFNRGNNREDLFIEDRNYAYFLKLFAKHVSPQVHTYAYCLLRNHFHVLIRVKDESEQPKRIQHSDRLDPATRGFTSMFQAYAMAANKAYGRTGKLFQEHFARIEVGSDAYLIGVACYIHLNPQNHGMVQDFRAWEWSSYRPLLSEQPTALRRDEVFAWFGGRERFATHHHTFAAER